MIYHLKTPITEETVRNLRTGDILYISGEMVTARDDAHKRLVREGISPEIDLRGKILYHCGPIVKGKEVLAAGPTTSMRMEDYEADFIEKTGVGIIVGKGGMGPKTKDACAKFGAVHCVFPGGCAVVAAEKMGDVQNVIWGDLGMPEAMWIFDADEFGPVIVNIDTAGGDLMEANGKKFRSGISNEGK